MCLEKIVNCVEGVSGFVSRLGFLENGSHKWGNITLFLYFEIMNCCSAKENSWGADEQVLGEISCLVFFQVNSCCLKQCMQCGLRGDAAVKGSCAAGKLLNWEWIKTSVTHFLCLQMVLSHLLPALDRLLEKVSKKPEEMLKDEVILLHLILGKFNEYSATLLCKNQQSLDLFIKSLHAAKKIYEEIPAFQITALGQVWLYEIPFKLFCT